MHIKHLLFVTGFFSGSVFADTTLVYNNKDGQENTRMFLSDGLVKITNQDQINTAIVFDTKKTAFTIINHQEKSYMVFGEKELEALGDVSKMMDKIINEQMAQLPESQRAQMRSMIESMVKKQMPKQAPLPNYKKSGQTDSYNGFSCDVVVKEVNGQSDGSFCVTDYQKLGVATAEYNTIRDFMKIAEKMAAQLGQDQSMNFDSIGQVLPVYYEMGGNTAYLTEVNNDALPSQTFQVPTDYKKESLPKELF